MGMDRKGITLPGKLTGRDRVIQENHEFGIEKQLFDNLDRVDRRDRQGEIVSFVANNKYRINYDLIDWST